MQRKLPYASRVLHVEVSGVWTRTPDALIIPRAGARAISLEAPDCFINDHDFEVPIRISEGLLATDAALRVVARPRTEKSDVESIDAILLLSSCSADGSGIALAPPAILQEPSANITNHMLTTRGKLAPTSLTLHDFKLEHLLEHFQPHTAEDLASTYPTTRKTSSRVVSPAQTRRIPF